MDTNNIIIPAPWPPISPSIILKDKWSPPLISCVTPLPLRELSVLQPLTAAAAMTHATDTTFSPRGVTAMAAWIKNVNPSDIVLEFMIGKHDMATVYMSPDPYFEAFKETIDLRRFDLATH